MSRKYGTLDEMAKKNESNEWICKQCGENLGEGHHAKVLAHWNLEHRNRNKGARKEANQGEQAGCNHDLRKITEQTEQGRGAAAIEQGYKFYCVKCKKVFKKQP